MWKNRLREIIQEKRIYGEEVNQGASEEEIQLLLDKFENNFQKVLPYEYVKFLEEVNGIEFNGFILYGVDQEILANQSNQYISGIIECNKIWYENEWQRMYVFLGESNISWYVYDTYEKKFLELDNPSGRKNKKFLNLEHMLGEILNDALK